MVFGHVFGSIFGNIFGTIITDVVPPPVTIGYLVINGLVIQVGS
jgi:hypothetical protein